VTLPSHANSKNEVHIYRVFGERLVKFTQVHWFGKEFHTTVVTHKFAKIIICFCSVCFWKVILFIHGSLALYIQF